MSEKVIIRSENGKAKSNAKKGLLAGIAMSAGGFVLYLVLWTLLDAVVSNAAAGSITYPFVAIMIIGLVLDVYFGYVYFSMSKCSLTVTDTKVYGCAAFGKKVDLPIDSITAVGTGAFDSIVVTTPSGAIKFVGMENKADIHSEISKLLDARQRKPQATTTIKQEIPQSNADELKKYKDLLDGGIISQEEFDAKKKQLLGL